MTSRFAAYTAAVVIAATALCGCGPTYPKERLKESIIRLCKTEYKLDVKVRTVGRTVAIYMPVEGLLDFTFALTPEATEKLNDVIMSVTRVVLSTDADCDFYVLIAHDVRIPEIQVIIIKRVEDVKRAFLGDISRGEFGKRMIVDMRLSPQAQKERSVREVFQKMNLDPGWQDKVMNDFFRSEPTGLGDIGYWNGMFYIKDITLPEFMAEQMATRIKMDFREDRSLAAAYLLKSVKAAYYGSGDKPYFRVEFLAEARSSEEAGAGRSHDMALTSVLKVAETVVHAYAYDKFDHVEVANQADSSLIKVSKEDLENLRTRKLKIEEIVR